MMLSQTCIFTTICSLCYAGTIPTPSLIFDAPAWVPANASSIVRHDFASFSWPAHFFGDFAGNASHPNLFTKDILDLLANKSGAQPFIRVGGTSTDRVWYNESQALGQVNEYSGAGLTGALGIASKVSIGPAFFEGFLNLPNTPWSWQINMGEWYGQPDAKDNAMTVAKLVLGSVGSRLESFEIGNEPDIMGLVGERPTNYTMAEYVAQWNEYADAASEEVLQDNPYGHDPVRFFQGCTFSGVNESWTVQGAFDAGLDQHGHVASISLHHYDDSHEPWTTLGKSFMNHSNIASNISSLAKDISATHEHNVPFVLGETNSDSSNLNFTQAIGVFGSALWQVDRLFTSMAAGIKRSNFIQGTTFGYTSYVPVTSGGRDPYVRPPLYAHILAADALGHAADVQVYPLPNSMDELAAHAIYASGKLVKYVLINLDEWNSTTPYPRPSQNIGLAVPSTVKCAKVERLTGSGASADDGIQWAGLSWNYTDGRLAINGEYNANTVAARKGTVMLELPSTEAALVTLEY